MSMQSTEFTPQSLVIMEEDKAFTSSLIVAQSFEKDHKNVLQSIENVECSEHFRELNFQPSFYKAETGNGTVREYPAYRLTRDGFVFLVMGFTGKTAAAWKEKFLEAFNAMEQALILARLTPGAAEAGVHHEPPVRMSAPRPAQSFTPASEAQIQGLKGLVALWSGLEEGVPQSELETKILQAHGLPSFQFVQPWDMGEMEWSIIKFLYRATGEITEGVATPEECRVLDGVVDFGAGLHGFSRKQLEGIACMLCNVPDLDHLSPTGIRKAVFAVWTFLNRYPTKNDCLSEAKYAVNKAGD